MPAQRRSRRTALLLMVAPMAIALLVVVIRLGTERRSTLGARLVEQAAALADSIGPERPFEARGGAGIDAAFYEGAGWARRAGDVGPATLPARVVESLTRLDRAFATSIDARITAVAPVKDADQWDILGAVLAYSSGSDPARVPFGPLLVVLGALALAVPLGLRFAAAPGAVRFATLALPPGAALVWLVGAAGAPPLWAVSAFLGGLVFASIGASLVRASREPLRFGESARAWAFLAPSLAHLLVFSLGPIVFSLWLSFHEWDLLAPAKPFVGFDNYAALASDADFLRALRNTAIYVLFVPAGMAVALALALLVNRRVPGVRLMRAVFFLPYITSFVAISLVWRWMFQPDVGLLNNLLGRIGIPPQPWLSSPATALPSLMLMSIWMYAGYMMVIFLAGLQSIPSSLYESARIDGAGAWQRFRHITLPMLRPTTLFILVTMVIFMFQVFTAVYVMTEGGPLHATDVIVYHIYRNAWEYLRMGYASAMAWVLFAIVFVITLVQFRWLGERVSQ